MYEQVFNFNSRPFTSTPYVKHYFPASEINQAFGQASICIERGSGPVVAIGDIGTGKSLLLAMLESEYQTKLQVVNLVCSGVNNRREFLQNILFQIGKPFNMDSETELRFAVIEAAQPTEAFPAGLLLLVDEAELLTTDIFEEMRALSNIVVEGSPQVRLVLAGRKSLEELLAEPAMASFSQRIASRVFLSNLSRDETAAYMVEHINRVGGDGQTLFPGETAAKLHELTDGCPRLINQVCDFGLILAGTRGLTTVSASLIEEAWNDVQSLPMGSGSLTTASSAHSPGTKEDTDWTLIEFGQLEDDSPRPHDATVYDFENSASTEDPTEADAPVEEDSKASVTAEQLEPETTAVESKIDDELGIDLGSLQAMQDAAAARQALPTPPEDDSPASEAAEETQANESSEDQQDQVSTDDAARIAMEQQLAAVFGTPLPSSTSTEAEATNPGSEIDVPKDEPAPTGVSDLDSVEASDSPAPEVADADQTGSIVGAAVGSAAVTGALAAAINSFSSETPEAEDDFKPATSALDEQDVNDDQSATSEMAETETDGFVPATQPMAADSETDVDDPAEKPPEMTTESSAISEDQNPAESSRAFTPATSANEDPFGESFAVEASVQDRPTSDIIEQNQNALKISASDLEHVQPIHAPTPDEIIHPSSSQDADEASPIAGTAVGVNWMSAAADEPDKTIGDDATAEADEPPTDQAAAPTRGFSIMPTVEPVSEEKEQAQSVDQTASDPDSEDTTDTETTSATEPESTDHIHEDSSASDEISRQADEILARLNRVNEPTATDQEEQILADIQTQQREVSDSQLLIDPDEPQASLPMSDPAAHQDDSEMLVVNSENDVAEQDNESETFPMTDSPISSGRASRMDYEQLFDRLRNLPEGEDK